MQDGISNRERTQRTGYISTKHIYSKLHLYRQGNETKASTYTGKQKQGKALRPYISSNNSQALKHVYFSDSAQQHSFKSPKENKERKENVTGWWILELESSSIRPREATRTPSSVTPPRPPTPSKSFDPESPERSS